MKLFIYQLLLFFMVFFVFLAFMWADSSYIAGYNAGFSEGQKWKQEDRFRTWQQWKDYSEAKTTYQKEFTLEQTHANLRIPGYGINWDEIGFE